MKDVAVVSGAAGGIGAATLRAFAASGWDIIGIDLSPPRHQVIGRFYKLDLASSDLETRVAEILSQTNGVKALVNNAAIQIAKPLIETSVEEWTRTLQVNVIAAATLTKAVVPFMQPGSCIVNVGSIHSIVTSPGLAAYVTSKGAVSALTRAAALELACKGIRVNCVLPGAVDTAMLRNGLLRSHVSLNDAIGHLAGRTPLRRLGQPEDIANAVLFLADETRSSFITGQYLVVDGGASAQLSTE